MPRLKRNWKAILSFATLTIFATLLLAQYRILPGAYGVIFRVATATDTATLSTSQMAPGILIGTPTAAATYTTPTAAQFCSAFPQVGIQAPGTNNNWGYTQAIRNTSLGANTITLAAGAGVTLAAGNTNTIAQNHTRIFIYNFTSCANGNNPGGVNTVTIFSGPDSAH